MNLEDRDVSIDNDAFVSLIMNPLKVQSDPATSSNDANLIKPVLFELLSNMQEVIMYMTCEEDVEYITAAKNAGMKDIPVAYAFNVGRFAKFIFHSSSLKRLVINDQYIRWFKITVCEYAVACITV